MKRNQLLLISAVSLAALALSACGESSSFHCPEGYHDGGDRVCVLEGTCSPGYIENKQGDCVSSGALSAPELEVPDYVTAGASYEAKVNNPVGSSSYAWTIEGGTLGADAGDSARITAGSSGAVIISCVETTRKGASSPAGTATTIIVPGPVTPVISAPAFVTVGTARYLASVEPQGDSTYFWTIEGGTIVGDATGSSIVFEVVATGTIELTCTVTNTAGDSAKGTKEVTSIGPPDEPVITAPALVTAGTAGHVASVEPQDGNTYSWTIEVGTITGNTTGPSIAFEAVTVGTIELICTVTGPMGASVKGTKVVTSVPPPVAVITAPAFITSGTTGHVARVKPQDGSTYSWTIEGGTISGNVTGPSVVFEAGTVGTTELTCTVTNPAGDSAEGTREVTSVPVPVADITAPALVTAGTAGHVASVEPQDGSTYSWMIEGGTITGDATGPSIAFEAGMVGTIELTCTVTNPAGDLAEGKRQATSISPPAKPIISAPPAVEIGGEAAAEVEEQPGMTYAWRIEGGELDGSADGASVRFRSTSRVSARLTCTVRNEAGTSIDGTKTVSVFSLSYPSIVGDVVAQVAAGYSHTCALTTAGGVRCWGRNYDGQLGDGTTTDSSVPVGVQLASGVVAITAGEHHTCALTDAGGVWCWGINWYGQLGDGTTNQRVGPVKVAGLESDVVAISAGAEHTCALTTAGSIRCWGRNYFGQLGDGTWSDHPTPVAVSGLASGVVAITAGEHHTCALTNASGVWCWGVNWEGQLGSEIVTNSYVPVEVAGLESDVVAISAGERHTCAITDAGGVRCWGANWYGQLGDGTWTDAPTPMAVAVAGMAGGIVAITAGDGHTCALTTPGGVRCWGRNDNGQLGDGTRTQSLAPVEVNGPSSDVVAITAGSSHTCALTTAGSVRCWGANRYGQLGDGTRTDRSVPVAVEGLASGVEGMTAGGVHSCALTTAGGVRCWGNNDYGQLGDGTTTDRSTPVKVPELSSSIEVMKAGGEHTCALMTPGGVRCWGWNGYGQLGDGTTTSRSSPVAVSGLWSGVVEIAAGRMHTCALTTTGSVRCWGWNVMGQLGDGTMTDSWEPVEAAEPRGVEAIALGEAHTCALTDEGGVRCWGQNGLGELGNGTTGGSLTPVGVVGLASGVEAIATGENHTCALTSAGGVLCWGANRYGQLGDGTTTDRSAPVAVAGMSNGVIAITAGSFHTCALTSAGGVRCWGWNAQGQLGDGTTINGSAPVEVSGLASGVGAISAGGHHTCAVTSAGSVRCWGNNHDGQLGDGSQTTRSTPVAIAAGQRIAFSPPATATSGARLPLEELALASSGLDVTFYTWTPEVCSVSGTTLTIEPDVDDGALCGVIARQPGRLATEDEGGSISPAPGQLRLISIVKG